MARLLVLLEAHPVGGDVAGVAHGNAQPIRGITEGIHDFKGSCFLALQAVGVHRIHQRHGVFLRRFANDVESPVKVAADRQNFGAVDERLGQLALGHITIRDQHERPHAAPPGIGRGRGTGVSGAGADHGFATGFLGLADCHGHASILEGSRRIETVVFDVHLHPLADSFRNRRHRDQGSGPLSQGDHRCGSGDRKPCPIGLNQPRPVLHHRGGRKTPTEVLNQGHRLNMS